MYFIILSEVAQPCPTLCDPMDCSLPSFSVHGVFQARILEWVSISFSRGSSPPRDQTRSPALQADALPSEPPEKPLCYIKKAAKSVLIQLCITPQCSCEENTFSSFFPMDCWSPLQPSFCNFLPLCTVISSHTPALLTGPPVHGLCPHSFCVLSPLLPLVTI